ncbi:signal peptide peptidase SppA, 36K type [Methylocella silvestris BL2]|uniref:Signal peptide peptidase SppA, 36K type n=1 Tax=Methylocella silvestris (strain DSM 15510 / CIP 108128 / LMG 27833 / NCIMB 13906 / BL2) TaxID=395965 RepID=B8EMY9_METSB|nr:signal peptide peptidase SppA [Methylocella silvestris]ACK49124.1 signal peptide peptidase SppA, 36K type [Methylocella silvestris BL2]
MAAPHFADYLVERRLLRRRLSFWRILAFGAAVIGVLAIGLRLASSDDSVSFAPHIARLSISGLITGDRDTLKLISRIEESDAAAVLVSIDSPGGTTAGAERLYDQLRRLSAKKPTVAVVGSLAASGGYIAALGADQIVALGNSLVGSIGVLVEYPNVTKLLDTVGVKVEAVKSSPLKAAPNGFEPTSPEARAALASLVDDSFVWFKDLVRERRNLTAPQLAAVDDGRVFTGRQGLGLHLVDRLGGEREAIAWLEQERAVPKGLKIRDWKQQGSFGRIGLFSFAARAASIFHLDELSRLLGRSSQFVEARMLDGLVSIWQVDGAN